MNKHHKAELTPYAKKLRREMTKEERHLWYDFLKKLPETVYRQKIIDQYIVDFCIPSAKLIIELDGSQHYEEQYQSNDASRDLHLRDLGYTVLRYSNADVNFHFCSVCEDILNRIKPSP